MPWSFFKFEIRLQCGGISEVPEQEKNKNSCVNTDLYIFVCVGYELVSDDKHVWALFFFSKPVPLLSDATVLTVHYNDLNIFMLLIL